MILYHGSFLEIAKPDLVHSRPNVDFGRVFMLRLCMSRLQSGVVSLSAEAKTE